MSPEELHAVANALPRRVEQEAVYQFGRVGDNLNQLTGIANATGQIGHAHDLQEILEELLDAVRDRCLPVSRP